MDTDRPPDIVVVAGGAAIDPDLVGSVPSSARIIAADSGVARCQALGWTVDVAVGDFDSLDPSLVAQLDTLAGVVQHHDPDKDATDLELALDTALSVGRALGHDRARLLVVGLEGGRPDHALANLLVAASDRFAGIDVELVLDRGRAWVVHDALVGHWPPGAILSVIAVHGDATVSITGVRWPLADAVLRAGSTRGVSNETTGGPVVLDVHAGTVLCISPRDPEERP